MEDWFSLALHDDAAMVREASTNRAMVAVKHRTEKRFARYLRSAQTEVEFTARLSAIDDDLRLMSNEIAIEHSAPEPEKLYEAAVKTAIGFGAPQAGQPGMQSGAAPCPNCGSPLQPGMSCPGCGNAAQNGGGQPQAGGMRNLMPTAAEVPTDGYDRRTIDPDEVVGDTPAGWGGEHLKDGQKDPDHNDSKAHPGVTQDIEDHGNWRDEQSHKTKDPNPPKIKHKVEEQDLGAKNPYKEQVGDNTKTFGDTHEVAPAYTPAKPVLGHTRWHVLGD